LLAITLLSMSVLPFAAAMGVKSCLKWLKIAFGNFLTL
jgi:hypothetical protein